ncbi:hypothetical protein, partial [Kitasatospora albolonga]|uniref:hypothetical protein n=1 Tax=Kitasatospora albolonga TaxID=68173 RepID=UPI0031EFA18A
AHRRAAARRCLGRPARPVRSASPTARPPPGHAELAGLLASAAAPEAGGGEQPASRRRCAAFRAVRSDPSTATTAGERP